MPTIQEYKLTENESLFGNLLWKLGIRYNPTNDPSSWKTSKIHPFLENGRCSKCNQQDSHKRNCPATRMDTIINLVYAVCPMCKWYRISRYETLCYGCIREPDVCSCLTEDWCSDPDRHDNADYRANKLAEWKAKLAELGIPSDR